MFTVSQESVLTVKLIEDAIDYNEQNREKFDKLESYYRGEHPILTRKKPATAKNTKIMVNHAKFITDANIGYLLGSPVSYRVGDEKYDIEPVMQEYKKQTISDTDHEIAKDISIFGVQYELVYTIENEVRSKDIDVRNCICVYDDTVEHNKLYGIVYQKGEKEGEYLDVVVYDAGYKYNCVAGGKIIVDSQPEPHLFGSVPIIEYRNNSEMQGDFEQVTSLIDAYNILASDRVNDKEQLVESILVGYGVKLEKAQMSELLTNRTLFGLPIDSKVDYLTKQMDESQVDILRKTLESDIHKISMTPNMSDENFVGNSSGVAIRFKLLLFEQNVSNKERYFEKGLVERFQLYNTYLTNIKRSAEIPAYEIDVLFKRNLPQNDLEVSTMIANLSPYVDDETLVERLSFIDNAKEVVERNKKEDEEKQKVTARQFGQTQISETL